jgi:hypothetical protein
METLGLFVLIGSIYVTLWAFGIVTPSRRERVDPAIVKRLKYLGPLGVVFGVIEVVVHHHS